MARLFSFLLGASVLIFLSYTLIESIRIVLGFSVQTWSDMLVFFIGAAVIVVLLLFANRLTEKRGHKAEDPIASPLKSFHKKEKETPQHYRLIITAEDAICSRICSGFKHPHLQGIFEDSGYWYSNGETGPEWFTVTLETKDEHRKEVEEALDQFLNEHQLTTGNRYWS